LNGDTLTLNGEYVSSKSATGWEINRSKPISYEINGKTIEVDDPISDDFDSIAKSWIIEGKCLKKTDTLKLENAKSLLSENRALVEILPRLSD